MYNFMNRFRRNETVFETIETVTGFYCSSIPDKADKVLLIKSDKVCVVMLRIAVRLYGEYSRSIRRKQNCPYENVRKTGKNAMPESSI